MTRLITFDQKDFIKNQNRTKESFLVFVICEPGFAFQMETERTLQTEGMAGAGNTGVMFKGGGQGPGSRGDKAQTRTSVGR